jgi:hypothetical protein
MAAATSELAPAHLSARMRGEPAIDTRVEFLAAKATVLGGRMRRRRKGAATRGAVPVDLHGREELTKLLHFAATLAAARPALNTLQVKGLPASATRPNRR